MATTGYASTTEIIYANRICCVLLGPCCDQLRDVLRHYVPPVNFPHVIWYNRPNLPRLTPPQRDLILPRTGHYSGDYSDMDISLLYLLLRNMCNIPPHINGWGNSPDVSDHSLAASIERIHLARNKVGHSSITSLWYTDFTNIWSYIKDAVKSMDAFLNNGNKFEKEIDFLFTESMDPEQEEFYREQLRKQMEEDTQTKEYVRRLQRSVNDQQEKNQDLRTNQQELQRQLTDQQRENQDRRTNQLELQRQLTDQQRGNQDLRTNQQELKRQLTDQYTILTDSLQVHRTQIADLSRRIPQTHVLPEFQQTTLGITKRGMDDAHTFADERYSLGYALGIVNRSYRSEKIIACVDRKNQTTIIVYSTEICFDKERHDIVHQHKVLIKHPLRISSEAFKVNQHAAKNERVFTLDEEKLIRCCIDENSGKLWQSHSNLQMILADNYRYHKGKFIEEKCIVLYCLSKGFIPIEEERFPTTLYCSKGSMKVDVREGFFKLGPSKGMSDVWNDPLCMGCSISAENGRKMGSLGVFVDLPDGSKGFITCHHVLFNIDSHSSGGNNSSVRVCQPASSMIHNSSGNTICGRVQTSAFEANENVSIDAALVLVTSRMPSTGHFVIRNDEQLIQSGFSRTNYPYFTGGEVLLDISCEDREKRVLKSGNSTGLTTGIFKLNGVQVSIVDEYLKENTKSHPIKMCGQYEIISPETFFDLGDSGAAVFLKEPDGKLSCLGIAIGKTSGNSTIVTPIGPILKSLGLKEDNISKFAEPMDMS